MKSFVSVVLMLTSSLVWGAPFVISDPLTSGVTQCGVFLDSIPKVTIPVTAVTVPTVGNICRFDIGTVTSGPHSITMTAIAVDPVFGSQESPQSVPLAFTKPAVPTVPSNLKLTP
jgi:hypothetical protein